MKKLLAIIGILVTLGTASPAAMAAVELDPNLHPEYAPVVVIKGGNEADYGNYFLQLIAGGLLYLAGPTAILIIAISGLRYVTSHGDENAMEGAKKTLEWAIIGLVVIILSYSVIRVVITTVLQTASTNQSSTQTSTSSSTSSDKTGSQTPPPSPPSDPNKGNDFGDPNIPKGDGGSVAV